MGDQHPAPGSHRQPASEGHCRSQSTSAEQHSRFFDQEYFSDWAQPPNMSLADPPQYGWDEDGWGVGGNSVPLPHNNQDEPRAVEPFPSVSQPTHYEQQWSVASYPSPPVDHKQLHAEIAPTPSPIPYNHHSEQEPDAASYPTATSYPTPPSYPTAPSYPSPPNHSQSPQLAAAAAAPVASLPAATRPPLQVPYPDKTCSICHTNFVWKKTADRCFGCCRNKPGPKKIAAVIERAARGIDSCSTCYGEADRGDNQLCTLCYGRQKGKNERHAAKVRARKAREDAEAIFKGLGIAFDQAGQPQAGNPEPAVESPGVETPSVETPDIASPAIESQAIESQAVESRAVRPSEVGFHTGFGGVLLSGWEAFSESQEEAASYEA